MRHKRQIAYVAVQQTMQGVTTRRAIESFCILETIPGQAAEFQEIFNPIVRV